MSSTMTAAQQPTAALSGALNTPAVQSWLRSVVPTTLARYMTPERVSKIVLQAASRNPILFQCSRQSIIKSVAELVSLGLEPGGPLAQAYLVPRKNKGQWECNPMVSYRGFIALLRRSGMFKSVCANVVYEKDTFDIDLASETVTHKPYTAGDRGRMLAAYCIARFVDGGLHIDYMTKSDVDSHRARSPAKDSGPWVTDYEEMARKTVVRRASKYWPMSSEDMMKMQGVDTKADEGDDALGILEPPAEVIAELDDDSVVEAEKPALPPASNAGRRVLSRIKQEQPEQQPAKLSQDEAWDRAAAQADADRESGQDG